MFVNYGPFVLSDEILRLQVILCRSVFTSLFALEPRASIGTTLLEILTNDVLIDFSGLWLFFRGPSARF